MINFIKNKFLSLIQNTGLEETKADIRKYNYFIHSSQYVLGYAIGVGAGFGIQFWGGANLSLFGLFTSSILLGIPLSVPGYFIGLPVYNYWKNRNFKMFRKYEYFRKLQDNYFYHEDQVICMLKNKESQYIIISLFDNLTSSLPQGNESLYLSNKLYKFKLLLQDGNFGLAAKEFLSIYHKYVYYAQQIKDTELSSFDLNMLEAQYSLLDSYLHDIEDHSISNSENIDEKNTSIIKQHSIKGTSQVQYQNNKDKKIDWHKLINHQ